MKELSKLGRARICKTIGINDKNSIFIKNKDAFYDRMQLLNDLYSVDKLINAYIEECNKFKSERAYNKFLDEKEEELYKYVNDIVNDCYCKESELMKQHNIDIHSKAKERHIDNLECNTKFRIYFKSPVYEAIKFLCTNFIDVPSTVTEFLYSITGSNYLCKAVDIDTKYLSDNTNRILNIEKTLVSIALVGIISPYNISSRELEYVGDSELVFISSKNKSIDNISNIFNSIRNKSGLTFENVEVELFEYKRVAHNSDMLVKNVIVSSNKRAEISVYRCNTLELVAYLRYYYGENMTEYDKYFEINGMTAKLQDNLELKFIEEDVDKICDFLKCNSIIEKSNMTLK